MGFGALYSLYPDDKNNILKFYLKFYIKSQFCAFCGTSESHDSQVRSDFYFQMQTLRSHKAK